MIKYSSPVSSKLDFLPKVRIGKKKYSSNDIDAYHLKKILNSLECWYYTGINNK